MAKDQAKKLAQKIFDEFGDQIRQAVRGTRIPPEFIAGLVANEAGKDRQGNIVRGATRFEPHIYAKLKQVATNPRASFQGIRHDQLKDATDDALRALAHSYEATQMMGYWCIILGCTLADLKNPDKHFFYTVKLLQLNDQGDFSNPSESVFDDEMRQWNTGREKGKTYHENYVPNARLIRAAYRELEANRSHRSVNDRVDSISAASHSPLENSEKQQTASAGINSAAPAIDNTATNEPPPIVEQKETVVSTQGGQTTASETTTTQPKGDPPGAPPTQVSKNGLFSKILTGTSLAAIGTFAWNYVQSNPSAVAIVAICVTALILALVFRGAITDAIRMQAAADPDKKNVT